MTAEKIIPIRLSHSTLETFNRCERLFQLEKLLATDSVREESEHLSLGSAFGVGVASYLVHQDKVKALYDTWLAYWPEIETDKKSVPHVVLAMEKSFPVLDTLLRDYEVLTFNGKPAVELSFRINVTERYYFVGYIDVALQNRFDKTCIVIDAKSTGLQLLDLSPLYQNSAQALGYSIALDSMVTESNAHYAVGYFVAQMGKDFSMRIHNLIFSKTLLDRLNWFITLGGDIKRLELAEELGFYPRRGDACLKYNRPCKHFGTCTLSSLDVPRVLVEDEIEYDFVFELDELIDNHLERINGGN